MGWCPKEFAFDDNHMARLMAVLSVFMLCTWGLGFNWLPTILLACCWLGLALREPNTFKVIWAVCAALVLAFLPGLGMLYGVAIATIWFTTKDRALAAMPLALWLLEEMPLEAGSLPFNPIVRITACLALGWLASRHAKVAGAAGAVCVLLTVIDATRGTRFDTIEQYNDVGPAYRPGLSTLRNLGLTATMPNQGQRPLRGYLHGSKIPPELPGLIMVEHDQWNGRSSEPIATHNLQVDVPWHDNCWPGRQYLRFAIAKDGFLCSNLGGALTQEGRVELAYWSHGSIHPVLVSRGNTTWSADSDHFNNSLTIYNRWYLPELNRQGINYYLARAANTVLMLLVLMTIEAPTWLLCLTFLVLGSTWLPGDVRIAGGIGDPHDEGGASGVADVINTSGKVALPGVFGAKVLIVPEGGHAIHLGEKLVVLGGGSTLYSLSEGIVHAETLPLGTVNGIIDARIVANPSSSQKEVVQTLQHGTKVIGTSSPGRLPWPSLFD